MRTITILSIAVLASVAVATRQFHLDPEHCSFSSDRYSVQWAYEPHSKSVVFVLKQRSDLKNFWTGIGFGDRKKEVIDFIGVFVKNGQIGIADTYIHTDEGIIHPDASTNVQSIAFDYDVINKTVTAKFARSLNSPDVDFDRSLDGCLTFNFAYRGGRITRADIRPDLTELIERRICDIPKHCEVDLHSSDGETDEPIRAPTTLKHDDHIAPMVIEEARPGDSREDGDIKEKHEKPEIAASVDVSGVGDPCSFTGAGYTVDWTYNPETEMVDFVMKHHVRTGKWWSAVGIGDNMSDMDIAIMFISSGRPKRIRDYYSNSYGVPSLDKNQDWTLSKSRTKSIDGTIELGFSRKLETNDTEKDRSLDGCVLFQFAANGGHYDSGFEVRKHEEWPDLYKACDLKTKCVVKTAEKHSLPEISDNLDESGEEESVESTVKPEKRAKSDDSGETEKAEIKVAKKTKKNENKPTTTVAPESQEAALDADEVLQGKSGPLEEIDASATTNLIIQSELNGQTTVATLIREAPEVSDAEVETTTATSEVASEGVTAAGAASATTLAPISFDATTAASGEFATWTERTVETETMTLPSHILPIINGELNPFYKPTAGPDATTGATNEVATEAISNVTTVATNEETTAGTSLVATETSNAMTNEVTTVATMEAAAEALSAVTTVATNGVTTETLNSVTTVASNDVTTAFRGLMAITLSGEEAETESTIGQSVETTNSVAPEAETTVSALPAEQNSENNTTTIASAETQETTEASVNDAPESTTVEKTENETNSGPTSAPSLAEILSSITAIPTIEPSVAESLTNETLLTTSIPVASGGIPGEDGSPVDTGSGGDVVVSEEEFIHEATGHPTTTEPKTADPQTTVIPEVEGSGELESELSATSDDSSVTLSLLPITVTLDVTTTPVPSENNETSTLTEADSTIPLNNLDSSLNTSEGPEVEGSGESDDSIVDTTTETVFEIASTPEPGPFTGTDEELRSQLGDAAIGDPKKEGCGNGHEDYSLCGAYFTNYLDRVRTWAETNNERYEDQFGKACTLLSQVRNVKTLCCTIFVETCKGKIDF